MLAPFKAGDPTGLFSRLKSLQVIPGTILSGFDFPIGLPYSYAQEVGIAGYLSTLPMLGNGKWRQFFLPARFANEISMLRPFYPARPGDSRRAFLENGLGIPFDLLYRLCEKRQINRRAACPLFWTIGAQQVGKAAISGWRDLLIPAMSDRLMSLKIWPFSGTLADCCREGNLVVVETYPAEFYGHLGLSFSSIPRKSKRRQLDRQSFSSRLIDWAYSHQLQLDGTLITALLDGFGGRTDGEDRFDAVVGLYGMINIIKGNHPAQEPIEPFISTVEGWIFGQEF